MAIVTRSNIPWAKVKFFYKSDFENTDLTRQSLNAAGSDFFFTPDENNSWVVSASQSEASYHVYSTEGVETYTADYLAIGLHNLGTVGGVTVTFQYLDAFDVFQDVFTPFIPTTDAIILKEFDSITSTDFKLTLTFTLNDRPEIGYGIWGEKTELDFVTTSFDPNSRAIKDIRHVNDKGYLLFIGDRFTERTCSISISDVNAAVYANVKDWHEFVKRNLFFVAWETETHSDDIFIMRNKDGKLRAPIIRNNIRNVNISLVGRV